MGEAFVWNLPAGDRLPPPRSTPLSGGADLQPVSPETRERTIRQGLGMYGPRRLHRSRQGVARPVAPARPRRHERLLHLTGARAAAAASDPASVQRPTLLPDEHRSMFFDTKLWPFTRGGAPADRRHPRRWGLLSSLVGNRAARAAGLAARAGVFAGDAFSDSGPALRARGGGDGAARIHRARPRHDSPTAPRHGCSSCCAKLALREGGRARPRPLRAGAHLATCCSRWWTGVEQLETYFGEYLPQLFTAAATPVVVLVLLAFLDFPVSALLLRLRDVHLARPVAVPSLGRPEQHEPVRGVPELRRGVPRRGAGPRHPQGLRPEHGAAGAAARGIEAHEVFRSTIVGARHQRADPWHHRHRHRGGGAPRCSGTERGG